MQHADYPEVPDDFGHWLAGFIDGEGCFQIVRNGTGFAMRFAITLRDDDRPLLTEIQTRTGLGKIYARRVTNANVSGANPTVIWNVARKADILRLVTLLDRYPLRGKKMLDFIIWREAVLYRKDGRNRPRANGNWGPVPRLFDDLRAVRAYAPRG